MKVTSNRSLYRCRAHILRPDQSPQPFDILTSVGRHVERSPNGGIGARLHPGSE
jgi:hypothetical protein